MPNSSPKLRFVLIYAFRTAILKPILKVGFLMRYFNRCSKYMICVFLVAVMSLSIFIFEKSIQVHGDISGYGGNIESKDSSDITISEEILTVKLGTEFADVTAEYHLKNIGNNQDFCFSLPIKNDYDSWGVYHETNTEHMQFYLNGKEIGYNLESTYSSTNEQDWYYEIFKALDTSKAIGEGYKLCINTYTATLNFKKGETKVLTVKYKSDSYNGFLYDLRSSASVGNGKAGKFTLNFDYSALKYVKEFKLNIGNFKFNDKGVYTYTENNLDFAKQKAIVSIFQNPQPGWEYLNDNWRKQLVNKLYVSSNSKNSGNLLDRNFDTVWTGSANDHIELDFYNPSNSSIGILNGNIARRDLYYDYSRIKKASIEFRNKFDGEIHEIRTDNIYEFPDIPYEEIHKEIPFGAVQHLETLREHNCYVRIKILETYPGRKSSDVSVSEIFLFSDSDGENSLTLSDSSFFPELMPTATPVPESTEPPADLTTEAPDTFTANISPTKSLVASSQTTWYETATAPNTSTQSSGTVAAAVIITFITTSILTVSIILLIIKRRRIL